MKLTVLGSEGGLTQVGCAEDITLMDFQAGGEPLQDLLGPGCYAGKILLNLERASFIDSAGVGWLVKCHKHCQENGGRLVLHSIPPMIHHVFQLLRLHSLLHLAPDQAAAVALAQGSNSAPGPGGR